MIRPLLALLLGLALTTPANAADDLLPFDVTETTLDNGLKVIVVPTGFPNIVSIQIPVQTGSRNEVEPGKSGFAHFFEHMMFRGTERFSPDAYQDIVTRSGARQNAYTTDDYTNYHTTFAKEDLEKILEIEADRFQNLAYSEDVFKTESRAVLGEYNKNSANPLSKLLEVQRDHAFEKHTYKHTTMGFLADIEDMPNQYAYARTFFDRWYRPEHAALIVAGDVDAEAVLPLVKKYWGGWQRGSFGAQIPAEPPPQGPVYAHVPWESETLPWVTLAFRAPAFSETDESYVALDMLMDLTFGPTSALYKRLVEDEQKVDQLFPYYPPRQDPTLATVFARVKKPGDVVAVRDAILGAFAAATAEPLPEQRVADAVANSRYALLRSLDNTEDIAGILARFVQFRREYGTLNQLYRVQGALSAADLHAVARAHFTDARLVVTTLSHEPLPEVVATPPALASFVSKPEPAALRVVRRSSPLPQLNVKLLFGVGSAHDPEGKQGLAALAASMIAEAGSRDRRIDEIKKALFPMAGSIAPQVDREMTTLTLSVHRDNWDSFSQVALPMLTGPGFRDEDFARLRDAQRNALLQDLRTNNEEELGKERLQQNLFAGTPYGHTTLGSVAGIDAISLGDVKAFVAEHYTLANLRVGLAGALPEGFEAALASELAALPAGSPTPAPEGISGRQPDGLEVEIVEKETRATAISFGHPIAVTRSHPDYPALYLARTWLGEHRSSMAHLYQRIRELRGMNYGDYAYIEAFPRGMFQFFPDPNLGRRAQIFEVWIRPLRTHEEGHMALRIALHEVRKLIADGLDAAAFEATRNYLMKNVFVMTATQDQEIGYALDSEWYGIPEYTSFMRERLATLSLDDVNAAIRKHLSGENLAVVIVTKGAEAMRERLLADAPSAMAYETPKPELEAEDALIGSLKLGLTPERVRVTPVEEVFAK